MRLKETLLQLFLSIEFFTFVIALLLSIGVSKFVMYSILGLIYTLSFVGNVLLIINTKQASVLFGSRAIQLMVAEAVLPVLFIMTYLHVYRLHLFIVLYYVVIKFIVFVMLNTARRNFDGSSNDTDIT